MKSKMKGLKTTYLILIFSSLFVSCSPIKEVSIHNNKDGCAIWIFRNTGKTYLVGHGGLFQREQSRYVIDFANCEGKNSYTELKVKEDDNPIKLTSGFVEFLSGSRIRIELKANTGVSESSLLINGNFKLTKH